MNLRITNNIKLLPPSKTKYSNPSRINYKPGNLGKFLPYKLVEYPNGDKITYTGVGGGIDYVGNSIKKEDISAQAPYRGLVSEIVNSVKVPI